MRARARLALVVLTLLAAASGSLGLVSPASAASAPKVGQCHQLTPNKVLRISDTKPAVSCSKRHNLQTIAVVTSPTSLAGLSDDELSHQATHACLPAYYRASGSVGKLALTAYNMFLFAPTPAQRAAGARWFRCDLVLSQGRTLASLPSHRIGKPFTRGRLGDNVRRCLTAKRSGTPCSAKHVFRSTRSVVLPDGAYPTTDAFIALGDRRCPQGTDLYTWSYEVEWRYGDRTLVCYDRTKK